jgi:protocatechuate 3,4-dioxygenase alpha subunit
VADGFRGWGRVVPDFDTGTFTSETVKSGVTPGRNRQTMAPHLNLWLVARGINIGLNTRMYFGDEPEANAADPVLNLIEQAHRRDTLIARAVGNTYHFDIRLQGDGETVFLDV